MSTSQSSVVSLLTADRLGLGNPYAANPFLRDVLGYKQVWVYYLAILADMILRCNWILYFLIAGELQHSAGLAFAISFSEVCRRGIWSLFRVENEHCTNVERFRASRDVPLPYHIPIPPAIGSGEDGRRNQPGKRAGTPPSPAAARTDVEQAIGGDFSASAGTARHRRAMSSSGAQPSTFLGRGLARVGMIMAKAHAEDFERKREPAIGRIDDETSPAEAESENSSD